MNFLSLRDRREVPLERLQDHRGRDLRAVFSTVSEGAQALFVNFADNEMIGLIAAGLLVLGGDP